MASVQDLEKYWDRLVKLAPGESMEAIYPWEMPPWDEICAKLRWRLFPVDDKPFTDKDHGYWGVYRIVALAVDRDLTKPATLNRICGEDKSGTLYIGRSTSLHARLNQFQRTLLSKESSHGAAQILKRGGVLHFPPTRLAIALLFTPECIKGVERDLIDAYMNSFGDTPPLNYSL